MKDRDRILTLIGDNPTCMMVTQAADGALRARPMHAMLERAREEIWFYTRLHSGKSRELEEDGAVCLCFASPAEGAYVSISGAAALSTDRAMVRRCWSPVVDAWFPEGPDGADVAMIRVTPISGDFWTAETNDVLAALERARASAEDRTPDLGDHGAARFT